MRIRQHGFSLLEVLVAFSILALALGVLMQIFSGSLRNVELSRDQAQAVVLAQTLLAAAGVEAPLTGGEASGSLDGKFRWRLLTEPAILDPLAGDSVALTPAGGLQLWQITAQVSWGGSDGTPPRDLSLTTLRVQVPPRP